MSERRAEVVYPALRVLVVDDARGMLEVLSGYLSELRIATVLSASDGGEALERLKAADGGVDLIITDVRMPEMSGYEFIRRVRLGAVPACKDVPILILTGFYSDDDRRMARVHRIQGYILKPPTIEVLDAEIRSALGLPRRPTYG